MSKNGASPSVLLAVKEVAIQRIIRDFLRSYGIHEMGNYMSAKEAVGSLRANPGKWDIFILDRSFSDSLEKVLEIRDELNSDILILFLLPNPTKEEIVEAAQLGVNDFLVSPFTQQVFENKLSALSGKLNSLRAPSPFSVPAS